MKNNQLTIKQIQDHQFVGNYYHDGEMFNNIHHFVMDDNNSLQDRAEALRVMSDKGMGCGRDEHISDKEIVQEYIDGN